MASATPRSALPRHPARGGATLSRSDVPRRSIGNVVFLDRRRAPDFGPWFKAAFAAWLRARYAGPEDVSAAFGVRASTAWTWWNGENRASGDAVSMRCGANHRLCGARFTATARCPGPNAQRLGRCSSAICHARMPAAGWSICCSSPTTAPARPSWHICWRCSSTRAGCRIPGRWRAA